MTCSTLAKITLTANDAAESVIKVIGIGAYGKQAIEYLSGQDIDGIECAALPADAQKSSLIETESAEVKSLLDDVDMIFIVADADGVSDTTMNPAKLAAIAHERGVLTFTVLRNASNTAQQNRPIGVLLTLPHQTSAQDFNALLQQTVRGMVEVVKKPGLVNVDLHDVGILIGDSTRAMTGSGMATGADRAWAAATQAIESFSRHGSNVSNACSLLINVTSNSGLKLAELESVLNVAQCVAEEATIVIGSVFDETMDDALRVTVVAMEI